MRWRSQEPPSFPTRRSSDLLNGSTAANVNVDGVVEDSIRNIEDVMGGSAADILKGDKLANTLFGLAGRSEEHTSELQSQSNLVCRLLLEKKKQVDTHCRAIY